MSRARRPSATFGARSLRGAVCEASYVIVYVPDVDAAVEFYERAFGLKRRFVHKSGTYAEMETGATALAFAAEALVSSTSPGFRANRMSDAPACAEVGLVSENVPEAFAKAVAEGAISHVEPQVKPWGQTVAYVRDLNGFLVELCSPMGR